jgi:hypothetical protein
VTTNARRSLVWHIDRARFVFEDAAEYAAWARDRKVFFRFCPTASDDEGVSVFTDAAKAEDDFEITAGRGNLLIKLEERGPDISAWVEVAADLVPDLTEDTLSAWSSEMGGWITSVIHLGEACPTTDSDDGGEWRLHEEPREQPGQSPIRRSDDFR